ncbi:GAF domain-containing protein [Amycolatopsis carbonis]|uniref:GAF domain-containing protein n=1 Tax=Amycolatopsis carbonis TaxID=715471 RepID=A0A9Y2IKN6_9PSEU|nr:GAF domain-containing protein [Amycolatopsis sp. 2-15]WIX81124.1 GAF domain-containing protein [Amycolatopsis sp. 2-15]
MDTNGGVTTTERDLARLLHLLADETGATGEFDRLGEDLAGEGDGELVALTLTRAARIRGLLADRKRREREMQALLDTASDLASVREVDAALDAIVARARRLLGTDAAYMALVDPETGDAYMRVTLGTITRPIESLRQPPGYGVGGWVAQEGRPFATANYLRDDRIRRKHSVASAVAEDGIVSILGVPMRVGSEVIGVLFGANRDERTFAQSEIDLLGSLADHAAIVLENARLFAATKATAEELTVANDQLARHNKALEQAATAHEQLMAMVLRRADLAELVAAVAETLDGAVLAAEPDGTPLAKAGPVELLDRLPELPPDDPGPARPRNLRPSARRAPALAAEFGRTPAVPADRPEPGQRESTPHHRRGQGARSTAPVVAPGRTPPPTSGWPTAPRPESAPGPDRGRNARKTPAHAPEPGWTPSANTGSPESPLKQHPADPDRRRNRPRTPARATDSDNTPLANTGPPEPRQREYVPHHRHGRRTPSTAHADKPDGTPPANTSSPEPPQRESAPHHRRDQGARTTAPVVAPGTAPAVNSGSPQSPRTESAPGEDRGRSGRKAAEAAGATVVETSIQPPDEPGIGRRSGQGRDAREAAALAVEGVGTHLVADGLTAPAALSGESGNERGGRADETGKPGLPEWQTNEPGPGRVRDLGRRAWTVPVRAGGETFGHLVFAGRVEPLETDKRILERSAQTAALLLLVERQMSAAEQQVRGQVVDELLAEREPDWAALRRRAKVSGAIDFAVRQTVLVVSATGTTRRRLLRAAADYVRAHGGVATEHGGHVVLLLPCADATAAVRATRRHLERATGGTVTAGVAGPAATAPVVRSLHREAERCHRLLVALGRAGTAASLADLGVLGLVLDGASREHVRRLVEDSAGAILAYDDEHGSLLAETLDGYFAAGENPRAAARRLQVHANTVYQRLDRVDQVLGHRRWREPAGALTLRIALQLRRVIDQIPVVS